MHMLLWIPSLAQKFQHAPSVIQESLSFDFASPYHPAEFITPEVLNALDRSNLDIFQHFISYFQQ